MDTSKIACATYSFRNEIRTGGWTMEHVAAKLNELGIPNVEINNIFTTIDKLPADVDTFKEHGIKTVLLTFDGNNFFQKKEKARKAQLDLMAPWIDAASGCSIPFMRANMGRFKAVPVEKMGEPLERITATFAPILARAEDKNIVFSFENHGSISSDVDFQLMVKKAFPSEHAGFLLDTGNYKPKDLVYDNITKLGKAIKIVHAKMYEFDADGNETVLDFHRIKKALDDVGYDGYYSIEYEGSLPDIEGVTKALDLLKRL